MMAALLGFLFGFIGSIPIAGPVSILVLTRAIEGRTRNGIYLAAGAAIAEATYAGFAFLGFSSFLAKHAWVGPVSRIAAAAILLVLGILLFFRRPTTLNSGVGTIQSDSPDGQASIGNKRNFVLGFSITALNPVLIATWTAAVTTAFSTGVITFQGSEALPFSFGVGFGIVAWFAVLLLLSHHYRKKLSDSFLRKLGKGSAVLIFLIGLLFLVRVFIPSR